MKLPSVNKPAAVKPKSAPAPAPVQEETSDIVGTADDETVKTLEVLLAQYGALLTKLAPFKEQLDSVKARIGEIVLAHGEGAGATKTILLSGLEMKISPKKTYTISQDDFRQMVASFPKDRRDVPMTVVRWKSDLDKRKYNALANVDREIVDQFVTSKEGKPSLRIKAAGADDEDEE